MLLTDTRLPRRLDDLRGPASGVIKLPRHLSWPGLRECDISDDPARRKIYGLLLTQGLRSDIVRFINGPLLRRDWPLIRDSLDARVRRQCERRYALRGRARAEPDATSAVADGATHKTESVSG